MAPAWFHDWYASHRPMHCSIWTVVAHLWVLLDSDKFYMHYMHHSTKDGIFLGSQIYYRHCVYISGSVNPGFLSGFLVIQCQPSEKAPWKDGCLTVIFIANTLLCHFVIRSPVMHTHTHKNVSRLFSLALLVI